MMMDYSKLLWVGMVLAGALARLLPHPWNFTPLLAMGLFAGYRARTAGTGMAATLSALVLSDIFLGFYSGIWYVYGAAMVPVLIGRFAHRFADGRGAGVAIGAGALGASVSFFGLTNFMVWATGTMYPHNGAGLAACFAAGIPFYQNQLLGDAFYTVILFGGYAVLSRLVLPVRQVA